MGLPYVPIDNIYSHGLSKEEKSVQYQQVNIPQDNNLLIPAYSSNSFNVF
ncbi:hypothetical protein ABIE50_005653 [Chitinophaga sp. OAE865]